MNLDCSGLRKKEVFFFFFFLQDDTTTQSKNDGKNVPSRSRSQSQHKTNANAKEIQKLKDEYNATQRALQNLEADILGEAPDIERSESARRLGTLQVNR